MKKIMLFSQNFYHLTEFYIITSINIVIKHPIMMGIMGYFPKQRTADFFKFQTKNKENLF